MESLFDAAGTILKERLGRYIDQAVEYEYGTVSATGDGIIQIDGLSSCRYGELIEFENNIYAMAMDLSENGVGAVLLNGINDLRVGQYAKSTGRIVEVPVGNQLLGRLVSPIGMPLDGRPMEVTELRPIECPAPVINDRQNIDAALETGILAIDSMIPVGRGQRELIIGDRKTGKTTLAIDCILNQRGKGVVCVYVTLGQKASSIANLRDILAKNGAMDYTIIVAASASDCAAMQYIAPYAGCSIAEHFMHQGMDVLIVYDDLSKHAVSYRTMSLLLKRPPGREAYPGDIFYLHSRLLERSARLKDSLGGGSLTALPIVETTNSDISAYIPTNIISITDGQIYLSTDLFHSGIKPAINVGLSVSRVGRAAQKSAMRAVSGKLRLALAQYREMQIFSQFDSDVDVSTRQLLDHGARLTEIFKQNKNSPYTLSEEISLLLSADFADGVSPSDMQQWRLGLLSFLRAHCKAELNEIDKTGGLSDKARTVIIANINQYKDLVVVENEKNADA